MLFDDILCKIGEFGIYQVVLYCMLGLVGIPTGWQHFAIKFVGGFQEHFCRIPRLENVSYAQQKLVGIPMRTNDHGEPEYSRCFMFDMDWNSFTDDEIIYWNRTRRITRNTAIANCSSWIYDRSQYRSTLTSEMNLVCDRAYMLTDIQNTYVAGFLVGSFIFGAISDRYGRHKTLVGTLFLEIVFGVAAALTTQYTAFRALRFLVGAAVAGSFNTAFVMVMESIGGSRRMGAGIFVQGWFAVGCMTLPGIAYSVREQKKLQFILALPVAILLIYYWIVPESARWYATDGRYEESEKVLRRMAEVNGRELPEKLHLEENRKEDDKPRLGRRPTLIDLLWTPNLRRKSLLIFFLWWANAFVYYGFFHNVGVINHNIYLTIFLNGLFELPSYVCCVGVMNRFGRRWPLIFIQIGGAFMCILCIFFLKQHSMHGSLVACSLIGKILLAASYATLNVYSAEIFPTVVRAVGVGTGAMFAGGGRLMTIQVATLGESYPPAPMIFCAASCVAASIVVFFLPETVDHKLPETLAEGERFGDGCVGRFMRTGHLNSPFTVEKQPESAINLGPPCTLGFHIVATSYV